MALNYSHRPIFPAHTSEDSLVSPLRIMNGGYVVEGMSEKGGEGFVNARHGNGELQDHRFDYGMEKVDKGGSPDSVSKDIIDLLPSDPFGMDIDISTTFTAIKGLFGDFEMDYGGYMGNNIWSTREDYGFLADLIWNSAMRVGSFPSYVFRDDTAAAPIDGQYATKCDFRCVLCEDAVLGEGAISHLDNVENLMASTSTLSVKHEDPTQCLNVAVGEPPEGFGLALGYLGMKDLLSVECVCKSLCSTIRNDPLLWRCILIDHPLNERITDDVLLKLAMRAGGYLQSLSLIKCSRITNDGLKRVLDVSPRLTKLSIPGCTRLSMDGILGNLRAFKSSEGTEGIKYLKTGGFYGITHEHYQELKSLLEANGNIQQHNYQPRYYRRRNYYLFSDDDGAIDVELCQRCQNLRLVYDCPAEGCQVKDQSVNFCRACIICIPRCVQCGRCVNNSKYEETFSLEYLCSECSPGPQDVQELNFDDFSE